MQPRHRFIFAGALLAAIAACNEPAAPRPTLAAERAAVAARYTLCDNFFHAAFGGSFLNHFWLIAARTPVFAGAPTAVVARLDAAGNLVADGFVTPDGYAVNTAFSVNQPHPSTTPA